MAQFRNIVVAVDVARTGPACEGEEPLSAASTGALEKAAWVARRWGAPLHVLTALDIEHQSVAFLRRHFGAGAAPVERTAAEQMDRIAARLRESGLSVTTEVATGRASAAVIDDVQRNGRDLVVAGTRERGAVARNLLGSTSLQLLRRCPVAVWIARSAPSARISRVLAPVGLGDLTPTVLSAAASLAADFDARLAVVHAVDPAYERVLRMSSLREDQIAEMARERIAAAGAEVASMVAAHVPQGCADGVRVEVGDPVEVVVAEAGRRHPDLVVIGSVVHSAARGVFLGSTAEQLLPALSASLLVVKPGAVPV